MNSSESALRVEFDSFRYLSSKAINLGKIQLDLRKNEVIAIMGSSGSGKTTLLKICAELSGFSASNCTIEKSGRFAFLFQQDLLLDYLSVRENIQLPAKFAGIRGTSQPSEQELYASLGLSESMLSRYPFQLSGGQRKRVAIARALNYPGISGILMDEPFVGIDEPLKEDIIQDLMNWLNHANLSCVVTTHDPITAVLLADRILFLGEEPATIISEFENSIERNNRLHEVLSNAFLKNVATVKELLRAACSTTQVQGANLK